MELSEKSARLNEINIALNLNERDHELMDAVPDEGEMIPVGSFESGGTSVDPETGISPDACSFLFTIGAVNKPERCWLGATSDEYMLTEFEAEFAKDTPAGEYTVSFTDTAFVTKPEYNTYIYNFDKVLADPVKYSVTITVKGEYDPYMPGDIDMNGTVDPADASLALTAYARVLTGKDIGLTNVQQLAGDVNRDGVIDAEDASKILTYYSNIQIGKPASFE